MLPPSRRPGPSALLVAGAAVLLISIFVGQKLGDRVLLQTTARRPPVGIGGVTPIPNADASAQPDLRNWKRLQVVSVATDPAFPDPRVTRPPTPPPPPVTPTPRPTPRPIVTIAPLRSLYTSPPLPIPLVSHDPSASETEPPTPEPPPGQ